MDLALQRLLWSRIDGDSTLDTAAGLLILAATDSPEALERTLAGERSERTKIVEAIEQATLPVGAYLGQIAVEGFRGIGAQASLPLQTGPGLTLVVGRNGSGKSSFAEAVEMLLTGDNRRWAERSAIWREGWRNLHHPSPTEIVVELALEGSRGGTIVRRRWPEGMALEQSVTEVQPHGQRKTDLTSLGWEGPLNTFRPFLSYNELGSMLDEGPSRLYDAVSSVLGLEDLVTVEKLIGDARKVREKAHKDAQLALTALMARLKRLEDGRARASVQALTGKRWDIDAVESIVLVAGGAAEADSDLDILRRLSLTEGPRTEAAMQAATRLREAAKSLATTAGTDAEQARKVSDILQLALELHAGHGDGDCPVCGRSGALDAGWRASAQAQVIDLQARAQTAADAVRKYAEAVRAAHELLSAPPVVLEQAERAGIDASRITAAWREWAAGPASDDVEALADHLDGRLNPLLDSLVAMRASARAELERKESEWRPVARDLADWVAVARTAQRGFETVRPLKAAEEWMKKTASDLRNERFEPIAEEVRRIWEVLRLQSNVDLARPELEGTGTRRRVKLDVSVDGVNGAALAVMSQGELHCLALSLFLPRATLPESPFRFLVIDDPVQSMDPARVDGLARVLEDVGRKRQVVVFTHDDRLPEAVRRLGVEARILEVTRQKGSVVNVVEALAPVERHIQDALTIASDTELPTEVSRRLVPGFSRAAVEAACIEVVRRRRIGRGEDHAVVEQMLMELRAAKLAALALFDDATRTGDVYARLNQYGGWAADTFRAVNEGSHRQYTGDLRKLVRDARDLASKLRTLR